ncbi:MAG: methyl-accepting chemotaxis protein [Syntrophales bacterium]
MIRFFNNLKLQNKMLMAPMVVFLFLIILAYGTYNGLSMQKTAIDDIFNNRFKGYQNSSKILNDIANVHANLYKVINWVNSNYEANKVEDLSKQQAGIITENIELIKKTLSSTALTADERKFYQTALDSLIEYQKPALGVLEVALADVNGATMFMGVADEKFQILNKHLYDLLALENKLSKEKYDLAIKSFNTTLQIFLILFVIAVIVSFLTSIAITRLILSPIKGAIDVLKKVADGDLTQKIEAKSRDEIGDLVQSVNTMRIKMGDAVGQALQISQGLSESASDQAASIEETSASLDEIASMTRQNAANTNEANQLMLSAKQAIKKANDSMTELTRSMKEITGASEQTQKIVKSIDEIAFQTNLLALNAAVEAARAGEAGAGFAVVADEVRNLAMRATESARNSSNLIEDIVNKVKSGENLVHLTSSAFDQVTTSSDKVVELMGEIAAASQEQSQGIDQVNNAIAAMNVTTQQNAGSAEKLSTIMAIFKTENHDGGGRVEQLPAPAAKTVKAASKRHVVNPDQVLPLKDEESFQ